MEPADERPGNRNRPGATRCKHADRNRARPVVGRGTGCYLAADDGGHLVTAMEPSWPVVGQTMTIYAVFRRRPRGRNGAGRWTAG